VSIWKPVNDRIVQASRDTKNEIIGLLLGRLEDDTIIIEDSITGQFSAEPHRVTLPSSTLAKIADQIVSGRMKGNIVGWYHSHTEGGLFFSETDITSQKKLQQFSSLITGMVVDSPTGQVGYFRVDPQTGKSIRIPTEKVSVYAEKADAVPLEAKAKRPVRPTPTIEVRSRTDRPWQPTTRLILTVVVIALLASIGLMGVLLYRGLSSGSVVTIEHIPLSTATIGTPIEVKANVTGPVHNVTLAYAVGGGSLYTQVVMSSTGPGQYEYLISGSQVNANIAYYIKAFDTAGYQVITRTYQIAIADFNLLMQSRALTVYKARSVASQLSLLSINGFNQLLALSITGSPQGLAVTFFPNPAPPGTSTVNMTITSSSNAANGTFSLIVAATYSPPQSPPVTRQNTVAITVADFDLQVTPSSSEVFAGSSTSYTLVLTLQKAFMEPVKLSVVGLPQGSRYLLTTNNATVLGGGPGTTTITLQITVPQFTKPGTYAITISATGADIVHSRTAQLIVR
jgi:proteasome lid subunit RPN8/RPN11